ncbi:MAG: sugar phosphate nucleotidyltransferase [Candidatus Hydrothermarchaeales archaeon]
MKTVILCGGKGLRMGNQNRDMPKPLVNIGDNPILWHIMKIYSHQEFKDFLLCLGYLGEKIVGYFSNEDKNTVKEYKNEDLTTIYPKEGWKITCVDTGLETNTGGRIKKLEERINSTFFATYGDGVANIDLNELLRFHRAHNKVATISVVRPTSQFGILDIESDLVTNFVEKPILDYWVNGGFFVFEPEIFDYIGRNDVLEKDTFEGLVRDNEMVAYKHRGFWECMDTFKDNIELNEMWNTNNAKWAVWEK